MCCRVGLEGWLLWAELAPQGMSRLFATPPRSQQLDIQSHLSLLQLIHYIVTSNSITNTPRNVKIYDRGVWYYYFFRPRHQCPFKARLSPGGLTLNEDVANTKELLTQQRKERSTLQGQTSQGYLKCPKRISLEIPTNILQIFFRGVHKRNPQAGSCKTIPRRKKTELVEEKEVRKLKKTPNICTQLGVQDAAWLETKRRPVFMDHKGHQTLQVPTFAFFPPHTYSILSKCRGDLKQKWSQLLALIY